MIEVNVTCTKLIVGLSTCISQINAKFKIRSVAQICHAVVQQNYDYGLIWYDKIVVTAAATTAAAALRSEVTFSLII
jgi:hypothetical protein